LRGSLARAAADPAAGRSRSEKKPDLRSTISWVHRRVLIRGRRDSEIFLIFASQTHGLEFKWISSAPSCTGAMAGRSDVFGIVLHRCAELLHERSRVAERQSSQLPITLQLVAF
jgi:hypothetical protein